MEALRVDGIKFAVTVGSLDEHARMQPTFEHKDGAKVGAMVITISHDVLRGGARKTARRALDRQDPLRRVLGHGPQATKSRASFAQ